MSQIKVNSIIPVGGVPTGGGGGITQIVETVKTDTTSQSLTGSGNFFDISGMSVSITPTSTSSKVFVMVTVAVANGFSPESISLHFLDSPSTTSAVTYKVRWSGENGDTYYLNRNASNTNEGMVSVITVMEISA